MKEHSPQFPDKGNVLREESGQEILNADLDSRAQAWTQKHIKVSYLLGTLLPKLGKYGFGLLAIDETLEGKYIIALMAAVLSVYGYVSEKKVKANVRNMYMKGHPGKTPPSWLM